MAERGFFFNSIPGDVREYQASDFANYFNKFIPNGVFQNGQGLEVTANGTSMQTTVGTGAAFINGYMYENDEPLTLTHDIADPTYDRIDLVVIRLDNNYGVRSVFATVKQGTPSPNPIPPTLTDDGYIKELALAEVRIRAGQSIITQSQITDKRGNLIDTFGNTIVQSGSNSNGFFVRFSDGTQICWARHQVPFNSNGSWDYNLEKDFPAAFNNQWNVGLSVLGFSTYHGYDAGDGRGTPTVLGNVVSSTRYRTVLHFNAPTPSGDVYFYIMAMGRWK